jgi:DNA-binding CsgD family transcriptional regulator
MKLQRFLDVSQSRDLATLERRLFSFCQELDFGMMNAAVVVDKPGRDPLYLGIGNGPPEFSATSTDPENYKRDPVLRRLKRLSTPFSYDQSLYVNEGAGDLWEIQAQFGYRTGIAVALHLPNHRHFLLGVDREKTLPTDDEEQITRMFGDLQLLAVHAQDASIRLLGGEENASEDPQLTVREMEILQWTAEGKSAWEIGQILSVSEVTVKFHIRNVCRKFDSRSKHQAVLKAMSLGML